MKKSNVPDLNRYEELQPLNGKVHTPRKGYYSVTEVFTNTKYSTIYEANCLWKEFESDFFDSRAKVTIQLLSLKENSKDPENFDPEFLIGKVIHVESTFDSEVKFKGLMRPIVKCNWNISETIHVTIQRASLWCNSESLPDNTLISEMIGNSDPGIDEYIAFESDQIANDSFYENPGEDGDFEDDAYDLHPVE